MAKDCHTVWQNCLEIISKEVSPQSFQTWFKPIRPVKLVNHVLTIEVPSPFFYEWLEEYYVHVLKKAIDLELGPEGRLEYAVVMSRPQPNSPFTAVNAPRPTPVPQQRPQAPQPTASRPTVQGGNQQPRPQQYQQQQQPQQPAKAVDKRPEPPFGGTHLALNPTYTFETYIEGDCNRLARSAGIAISKKPGMTAFNPLVIYGGVGLGKTHLAQAIGNEILRNDPSKHVVYVSSNEFTTQFIQSLQNNNMQQFTNYYLQVDVLIVDDIQFLAGKDKTQETFFHIFNRLHQSNKQILMTSDRPPSTLQGLEDRLLSRFKWGLTADIQKPDFETRTAIIQQKLQSEGTFVPSEVVEYLAYHIDSNIRELEGALISLIANASLMRREIDLEMAKSALLNIVRTTEKEISIELIQEIVADYFSISVDELKSKTRKKDIANARQIAMYFSKEYTKEPLRTIGDYFGGKDHSTVVHACKTVSTRSNSDALYNRILEELLDLMKSKTK